MKTFFDVERQVHEAGLCRGCGLCTTVCRAVNYGALNAEENGLPVRTDPEKCIECGLCYMVCPETRESDGEQKGSAGRETLDKGVLKVDAVRSTSSTIRDLATDGGAVTGLLLYLFNSGRIGAAILARQTGVFGREPFLALSGDDVIESAGFSLHITQEFPLFTEKFSTYSPSLQALKDLRQERVGRVAFVGLPCQIQAVRRLQALGVDAVAPITVCIGLFCGGQLSFNEKQRRELEAIGDFKWEDVRRINMKEELLVYLKSQDLRSIPLERLDFIRRSACRFCSDYAAVQADLSFGGIGSPEGWTSAVAYTPLGRAVLAAAKERTLEGAPPYIAPGRVLEAVKTCAEKKQKAATRNRTFLVRRPPPKRRDQSVLYVQFGQSGKN